MTSCRVGETDWHWLKVLLFGQIFLEVNVLFLCFVLKMNHLLWFGVINKCSFWVIHGRLQWLWYCCNYVSLYTLEIIFTPRIRTHLFLIQMFAIYYCFCWHWDPLSWNSSRRKPLWATGFLCHTHWNRYWANCCVKWYLQTFRVGWADCNLIKQEPLTA